TRISASVIGSDIGPRSQLRLFTYGEREDTLVTGKNPSDRKLSLTENASRHDNYRQDEPNDPGSDRAFGYTVGTILIGIGAAKSFMAGAITPVSFLIFVPGPILVLFGAVAPSRLSGLNKFWLKTGAAIAKVL